MNMTVPSWRAPRADILIRWLIGCFGLLYVLAGNGSLPFAPQNAPPGKNPVWQGVDALEGLSSKGLRPMRGAAASEKNVYQYAPNPVQWIDPLGLMGKPSSPGAMQREVERGQAPRDVERVDRGHIANQEPHVHYTDGTSSNMSGGIHDQHRGQPKPPKKTCEWLRCHGWTPPKSE